MRDHRKMAVTAMVALQLKQLATLKMLKFEFVNKYFWSFLVCFMFCSSSEYGLSSIDGYSSSFV